MLALLEKTRLVTDLIGLVGTVGPLVTKFEALAPEFGAVFGDLLSLATDVSNDRLRKLLGDVRGAYEDFVVTYDRSDASVRAFLDALHRIANNS